MREKVFEVVWMNVVFRLFEDWFEIVLVDIENVLNGNLDVVVSGEIWLVGFLLVVLDEVDDLNSFVRCLSDQGLMVSVFEGFLNV